MTTSAIPGPAGPEPLRAGGLAVVSAAALLLALLGSFRGVFDAEPAAALAANGARVGFAALGGAALAMAGALRSRTQIPPLAPAHRPALAIAMAAAAAAAASGSGGSGVAVIVSAVAGGAAGWFLARSLEERLGASPLWLSPALLGSTVALVFAHKQTLGAAGIGPALVGWLAVDLSWATGAGALGLLAAIAATVAVVRSLRVPENQSARALEGVVWVGVGPLVAVAELVPSLVSYLAGGRGGIGFPALCALVGAGAVALADYGSRALVGGFAPPLNAAILFVSPFYLAYLHFQRQTGERTWLVALEWFVLALHTAFIALALIFTTELVAVAY